MVRVQRIGGGQSDGRACWATLLGRHKPLRPGHTSPCKSTRPTEESIRRVPGENAAQVKGASPHHQRQRKSLDALQRRDKTVAFRHFAETSSPSTWPATTPAPPGCPPQIPAAELGQKLCERCSFLRLTTSDHTFWRGRLDSRQRVSWPYEGPPRLHFYRLTRSFLQIW